MAPPHWAGGGAQKKIPVGGRLPPLFARFFHFDFHVFSVQKLFENVFEIFFEIFFEIKKFVFEVFFNFFES